jgi:VIT1/CCC1 family predicted Fe2+/Mn2+ transporter
MSLEDVKARNAHHKIHKSGWLRAAVLGSNDGLVATASLMIGIAAATSNKSFLVAAGLAGIVAGALSMGVGEYISVSSQTDIEEADRQMEIEHLALDPEGELEELTQIYMERGLDRDLANKVAKTLTDKDALEAHLRDELGQFEHTKARPVQAAFASLLSYIAGGVIPFIGAFAPTSGARAWSIVAFTEVGLIVTGILSARSAGSSYGKTTLRILIGGSLGMAITAGIGSIVHISGI